MCKFVYKWEKRAILQQRYRVRAATEIQSEGSNAIAQHINSVKHKRATEQHATQQNATQQNPTQQNPTQQSATQQNATQQIAAQQIATQQSVPQIATEQHNTAKA